MSTQVCVVTLMVVVCWASIATAQPDSPPSGDRVGAPGQSSAAREPGHNLRERLRQRREQLRRSQERVERALKMLEEGESSESLREEYPEFFRERQGGGEPDGAAPFDRPIPGDGEMPMSGPGRGGRGRDRGPMDRPMTDEDRAGVREFLKVAQPRLFEMLERLEKENPAEAQRKLAEAFPRVRPLMELRQTDPGLFELRMKDLRLGREAMEAARWLADHEDSPRDVSEADLAAKQKSLKAALGAQFDARTEIMRHELAMQTRRHEEAKNELERRAADRDQAVESIMARILERERERLRRGDGPDDLPPMREPGRRRTPGGDGK